jgi:SmpA / OmlA family
MTTKNLRKLGLIALVYMLTACGTAIKNEAGKEFTGYSCCNIRVYQGWIISDTFLSGYLLPFGEKVTLEKVYKVFYAYGYIGKTHVGFWNKIANTPEETEKWAKSMVVSQDPRIEFASYPAEVRSAIATSKVRLGMTKQQVKMSLGIPSLRETPDLEASHWTYWVSDNAWEVQIHFNAQGRVIDVVGNEMAISAVEVQ